MCGSPTTVRSTTSASCGANSNNRAMQFRSHTDTEVVLRGYLEWGRDVVQRLNGMFAFALYDTVAESLWLVRDGVGIKPLFYRDDGTRLWFGSEIKAILSDPEVAAAAGLVGPRRLLHVRVRAGAGDRVRGDPPTAAGSVAVGPAGPR